MFLNRPTLAAFSASRSCVAGALGALLKPARRIFAKKNNGGVIHIFFICIITLLAAGVFFIPLRTREYHILSGLYLSCGLFLIGSILAITKTFGVSLDSQLIMYGHPVLYKYLLYRPIPFNVISFVMLLGKLLFYAFSFLSIKACEHITCLLKWCACIFTTGSGAIAFLLFCPISVRWFQRNVSYNQIQSLNWVLIVFSLLPALFVCLAFYLNFKAQKLPWKKSKYLSWIYILLSLNILVLLFGLMGPLTIEDPRWNSFWLMRLIYYSAAKVVFAWGVILILILSSTIIGIVFSYRMIHIQKKFQQPCGSLEKKMHNTGIHVKIFTHGIKNQLIAQQILLNECLENPHTQKSLEECLESVREINRTMLNRTDEIYRIFKDQTMTYQRLPVSQIIATAVNKVLAESELQHIRVIISEDSTILADNNFLGEAVYNLVRNALDSIRERPDGRVEIRAYQSGISSVIEVDDTGVGIPEKEINRIFEPFTTSKNTSRNWGLGLSYAQKIVRLHYGEIRIVSEVNKGSKFYLVFPTYQD